MKCAYCGNIKKDSTELPFEKDLPSLKGLQVYFPDTWTDEWFGLNDVQEHCLDKARVKEAYTNLSEDAFCSWIHTELGL